MVNREGAPCAGAAISEEGYDSGMCLDSLSDGQKDMLRALERQEGCMAMYLGCGLCRTRVWCESGTTPLVGVEGGPGAPEKSER